MRIIIETPKYSFWKYCRTEKGYKKVFFSPLPTIFNYGFIEGTESPDGMEEDVVVLGPRLPRGSTLERESFDGIVRFLDDSIRDDKKVIYISAGFILLYCLHLISGSMPFLKSSFMPCRKEKSQHVDLKELCSKN